MKKLLWVVAIAACFPALAQRGGATRVTVTVVNSCTNVTADASCAGYGRVFCVDDATNIAYRCSPDTLTWEQISSSGGGGGGGADDFSDLGSGTAISKTFVVGLGSTMTFNTGGFITANGLNCSSTPCVTLGSETVGSYAAGDAAGGNATGVACTGECISMANEIADFTSAEFAAEASDETGSGVIVLGTSPTITTPSIGGFTASRCARFNASGVLVASSTGDCDSGDTGGGGGDSILISSTAVTDGSGVDFVDGAGVDISYNSGISPDQALFVADNTEVNDTVYGDDTDASITVTYNTSTGTAPIWTYASSTATLNVPLDVADQTAEPGNYDGIRDNDTSFTNDPTCANSGSAGELHILDSDESSTDQWDLCDGTSLKFRLPATTTSATAVLHGSTTAGVSAFSALVVADLPVTGTWTNTSAVFDFGASAGSVEIPNAAAPTVDATGEVAVDTTADQLIWFGASAVKVADPRETMSVVLFAPTSSDDPIVYKAPYGMTIVGLDCITGAATSVIADLLECDATGASCTTLLASTATCDADGFAGTISGGNAGVDAGDWIKIDVGTVTGTVGFVSITVRYTVVRE